MNYDSVEDYLESQRKGRPQTLKEISLSVNKSEFACIRELNGLILKRHVNVLTVRFNGKSVPFYTVRENVSIEMVRNGRPQNWTF
jgi:hypothetical protein